MAATGATPAAATPASSPRLAQLRVLIVGGGIGGLATALALQREGCPSVTVYERDASATVRRQARKTVASRLSEQAREAALGFLDAARRHAHEANHAACVPRRSSNRRPQSLHASLLLPLPCRS